MHPPNLCFELGKYAARHPRGWKSQLWRRGASKIVDKVNELSNYPSLDFLSSDRCSPPLLIQYITVTNTHIAIAYSGASGYLFTKDVPKKNADPTSPHIRLGTASGQPMMSTSTCYLSISQLPSEFTTTGHVMPGFQENLVDVVPMCHANCTIIVTKYAFNIYIPTGTPIITGWCETTGPCIWCMSIMPNPVNMPLPPDYHKTTTLQSFSDYDRPSVEALIQYFHADAGFPVCYIWLIARETCIRMEILY